MSMREALAFTAISLLLALAIDIAALSMPSYLLILMLLRMWSVTLTVVLCMLLFHRSLEAFKDLFRFSRGVTWFLLAPLIVYIFLGLYVVIATPLGIFDFSRYLGFIDKALRDYMKDLPGWQVELFATLYPYVEITAIAYIAAISINAAAALGEEIGWRGYLYRLLGSKPTLRSIIAIGSIWGLWHASAILLLGHNYQVNRIPGVLLFTILCILLTYPSVLVVSKSGGSVLPAASLHGMFNALWGLTLIASPLPRGSWEILGGLGLIAIAAIAFGDLVLYLLERVSVLKIDRARL